MYVRKLMHYKTCKDTRKYSLYVLQGLDEVAYIWVFPVQRFPLIALAFLDEAVSNDAELLSVDKGFSVGVGGGGDEQGVDLSCNNNS